jgi:hypothetical protein
MMKGAANRFRSGGTNSRIDREASTCAPLRYCAVASVPEHKSRNRKSRGAQCHKNPDRLNHAATWPAVSLPFSLRAELLSLCSWILQCYDFWMSRSIFGDWYAAHLKYLTGRTTAFTRSWADLRGGHLLISHGLRVRKEYGPSFSPPEETSRQCWRPSVVLVAAASVDPQCMVAMRWHSNLRSSQSPGRKLR